jgi:hypothetical protein
MKNVIELNGNVIHSIIMASNINPKTIRVNDPMREANLRRKINA